MRLMSLATWTTTLAAALLVAGMVASFWLQVTVRNPGRWRIEVSGGLARLSASGVPGGSAPSGPLQLDGGPHSAPTGWWPRRYRRVGWPALDVPLWMVAGLFAIPAGCLWWCGKRPRVGHCATCGYDRAGLRPNSACPECGSAAPTERL